MPSRVSRSWKVPAVLVPLLLSYGALGEPPPTNSGQGTRLHGTGPLEHVNIPYASAILPSPECPSAYLTSQKGKLVAKKSELSSVCNGRALIHTKLSAPFEGRTVTFKIEDVVLQHTSILDRLNANQRAVLDQVEEYNVTWTLDDGEGIPRSLCPGGGRALAVPYAWSTSGELIANDKYFTFACVPRKEGDRISGGGVIAKCIDWGYPPWTINTSVTRDRARKLHQVCTRMGAADYCGEGKANTLDGTPIAFYDDTNMPDGFLHPETLGGYHLEAVWGLDKCGRLKMLCLGKKRWNTLSLDGTCVDGRSTMNRWDEFLMIPCEEWSKSLAIQDGALLFSYSTFIDRTLMRFSVPGEGGGQRFMTTASVVGKSGGTSYSPDLNGDGASDNDTITQVAVEGPILSPNVMDAGILQTELTQHLQRLYRCTSRDGQIITVNPEKADALCQGERILEGYIYGVDGGIRNNPLYLWTNNGRYATSTLQPPGYGSPSLLGYLPPMSQLADRAMELNGDIYLYGLAPALIIAIM